MQAEGIGQRQLLVRELTQNLGTLRDLFSSNGQDTYRWKLLDQCDEVQCARGIKPPEKPGVRFRNHQRRRDEVRRIVEQAAEERVMDV